MIKRIINIFRNRIEKRIAFAWYQRFCPFEKNLVIFEAYGGEMNGYSCNSRAVYERMLRDETYKDFHYVWAFRDPDAFIYLEKNKNTTVVQRGSCQYLRACEQRDICLPIPVIRVMWFLLTGRRWFICGMESH